MRLKAAQAALILGGVGALCIVASHILIVNASFGDKNVYDLVFYQPKWLMLAFLITALCYPPFLIFRGLVGPGNGPLLLFFAPTLLAILNVAWRMVLLTKDMSVYSWNYFDEAFGYFYAVNLLTLGIGVMLTSLMMFTWRPSPAGS